MPQKGFAPVVIIIIVAVLITGGIAFFAGPKDKGSPSRSFQEGHDNQISSQLEWPVLWGPPNPNCPKNSSVRFSASPIDLKDTSFIHPMGELREGHIIPGDHGGYEYETSPSSTPVKVFAPADGVIVNVEKHPYTPPAGYPQNIHHYHFYIMHSCSFFTGYVHLTEFAPEILSKSPELKKLNDQSTSQFTNLSVNIPVKAGQQIGTAWSFGLFGTVAVDLNVVNKGYLTPKSYKAENWRMHSVAFTDYFEDSLKSQILSINPRVKEPRGGKIDFDIEGKIVGNWFEEGTGGLRDETKDPGLCGNFPCPYWNGHLALVYDYVDPDQLRVSVGYKTGLVTGTPYGVKGNGPDFKNVGVEDGIVEYELVSLKDISREKGYKSEAAIITENEEKVLGIMLVHLLEKQKLKMEIFPGKTKDQISGFTSKARVYNR